MPYRQEDIAKVQECIVEADLGFVANALFLSFNYSDPSHRSADTDVQRQAF